MSGFRPICIFSLFLVSLALACDTSNDRSAYFRGEAHALRGEHDKAIAEYTEAIRRNPNDTLAYSNRGASYAQIGNYQEGHRRLYRSYSS